MCADGEDGTGDCVPRLGPIHVDGTGDCVGDVPSAASAPSGKCCGLGVGDVCSVIVKWLHTYHACGLLVVAFAAEEPASAHRVAVAHAALLATYVAPAVLAEGLFCPLGALAHLF